MTPPRYAPAWLVADRPRSSIFNIRKTVMSLLAKILTKKSADAISPAARFESDLDRVIGDAIDRGINTNTLISILESREQSARARSVTTHRFGPSFVSGNID